MIQTNNRTYVYNFLAMPVQISDDAGVRNLAYNSYNEFETDSLVADFVTHLVTELRDDFGRSVGYTYAKNGSVQQTVSTGYGSVCIGHMMQYGMVANTINKKY